MFKNQQPLPLGRDHRGQHFTHLVSEQRQASLPFSHERDQNKGMCDDRARRGARPGGRAAAVLGEPASSPRQSPGEAGCSGAAPNPPVRSRVCDSGAKRLMRFEEIETHTLSVNPRPAGVTAGTPGTVHLPLPGAAHSQTEAAPVADTGLRASEGGGPREPSVPLTTEPPPPPRSVSVSPSGTSATTGVSTGPPGRRAGTGRAGAGSATPAARRPWWAAARTRAGSAPWPAGSCNGAGRAFAFARN